MRQEKKRAAIYMRVSGRNQAERGTSLITQEEQCRKRASEQNYRVREEHIYREVHTGREYYERPELTRLREAAKRGEFDVILVYAYDRLARRQVHQAYIIDELQQHNIQIESVTEPQIDDTPVGQFLRNTYGFVAELERKKIIARTQEGRLKRVVEENKLMVGGAQRWGFLWADKGKTHYLINPDVKPIIDHMADLALQGYTLRGIATKLMEEDIPNKSGGKIWRATDVQKVICDPFYAGRGTAYKKHYERLPGGKRKVQQRPLEEQIPYPEGIVPAIIDPDTFDAIQEKLKKNKREESRNNKNPQETLLNYGLAVCGLCGRNMRAHRVMYRYKTKTTITTYYECGGEAIRFGGCNRTKIKAETLDALVWEHVITIIKNPKLVAQKLEALKQENPTSDELVYIQARLMQIDEELENLVDVGQIAKTDAVRNRIKGNIGQLEDEQRELLERQAALQPVDINYGEEQAKLADFEEWCRNWQKNVPNATRKEKRTACENFRIKALVWPRDPITKQPKIEIKDYPLAIVSHSSKMSGMGRELGEEGLDEFRETKHVHWDFEGGAKHWWYPYGKK